MQTLILLLVLTFIPTFGQAGIQFTEVYSQQGIWVVDHFEALPGKLQELVNSHSFRTQSEAQAFAKSVKTSTKMNMFSISTKEHGARPLWTVTQEWNQEWEEKYAQWVEENLTKTFFKEHDLATDCADAAYALRWIFSRNNGLPAVATLAGSRVTATHLSAKTDWNSLPEHKDWHKDQRFLAGLNWLLNSVYTKTLYQDTYPVEINRSTIRPGLIHLMGGHAEIFSRVSYEPSEIPLEILASTMPRAVRELQSRPFLDSVSQSTSNGGLLRFRWPVKERHWSMIPKTQMPFYSLEQYQNGECEDEHRLAFCIFKKLNMSFTPELVATKLIEGIESSVKQRAEVVRDGFNFCQNQDCSPGTLAWEDWSTPTRDGRLLHAFQEASKTSSEINQSEKYYEWLTHTKITGLALTYGELLDRLESGFVSSDPRDGIESRWAETPEAISKNVQKTFREIKKARQSMVEKARPCRENPLKCQNSPELFKLHTTEELDRRIRKTVDSWWTFCRKGRCPEDAKFEKALQEIWFQSPAPWDPIDLRNGLRKSQGHLLNAFKVRKGGPRFVILDNDRLYDVAARTEKKVSISGSGHLGYDEHTGKFYLLGNGRVQLYDQNFNYLEEFAGEVMPYKGDQVIELAGGKILISHHQFSSTHIQIIDLVRKSISEVITAETLVREATGKEIFLLMGSPNRVLSIENDEVVFTSVESFDAGHVNSFFETSKGNYLVHSYIQTESQGSTRIYSLNGAKIKEFFRLDSFAVSLIRLNPHFFLLESWEGEPSMFLFDNDLTFHIKNRVFTRGKSDEEDSHLLFLQRNKEEWEGIQLVGKTLKRTGAILKTKYPLLLGFSENWFSYRTPTNYILASLQGQTLEKHPFRYKSTYLSSELQTQVYEFQREVGINTTLTRVGEDLAWVINSQANLEFYPDSYVSHEVKTGTGIKLENHVMLWFPQL